MDVTITGSPSLADLLAQESEWEDIASATTTDLGAAVSQKLHITGTTTITSFGTVAAGTVRLIRFADALTLTYDATSLILPTFAQNIVTKAGDAGLVVSEGFGNWRLIQFQPVADFPALPSGVDQTVRTASDLIVKRASNSTIDVDADELVLFDSSGRSIRVAPVDLTLNITVSGNLGLDTGTEASSTWYYAWVIAQADGTASGVLSASATSPVLPSGYVYKGRVGVVFNLSSGNFRTFLQRGRRWETTQWKMVDDGTATSFTTIDMSNFVAPIAKRVKFQIVLRNDAGVDGVVALTLSPSGSGTSASFSSTTTQFPNLPASGGATFRFVTDMINLVTPQSMDYRVAGGGGASPVADEINMRGFEI